MTNKIFEHMSNLVPMVVEQSNRGERAYDIYSRHTGKSVDEIKSALERDNFMTADVAQSFGLIDEVVEKRS